MYKKYSRRGFITISGILGTILSAINPAGASTSIRKGISASLADSDMQRLQQLMKQESPIIWLFTGDSITQGAKHTFGWRSYPEIFAERVRWELRRTRDLVINSAISGNITDNVLSDFEWRIGQFKPTIVSVMLGANDCVRDSITLEYFENKLDILLTNIRKVNAIPILHTPTMVMISEATHCKRLPEFVDVVKRLAGKREIILIDNWNYWQNAFEEEREDLRYKSWLDDPVHPNNKGHAEVAKLLFKSLGIFDTTAFTCKRIS